MSYGAKVSVWSTGGGDHAITRDVPDGGDKRPREEQNADAFALLDGIVRDMRLVAGLPVVGDPGYAYGWMRSTLHGIAAVVGAKAPYMPARDDAPWGEELVERVRRLSAERVGPWRDLVQNLSGALLSGAVPDPSDAKAFADWSDAVLVAARRCRDVPELVDSALTVSNLFGLRAPDLADVDSRRSWALSMRERAIAYVNAATAPAPAPVLPPAEELAVLLWEARTGVVPTLSTGKSLSELPSFAREGWLRTAEELTARLRARAGTAVDVSPALSLTPEQLAEAVQDAYEFAYFTPWAKLTDGERRNAVKGASILSELLRERADSAVDVSPALSLTPEQLAEMSHAADCETAGLGVAWAEMPEGDRADLVASSRVLLERLRAMPRPAVSRADVDAYVAEHDLALVTRAVLDELVAAVREAGGVSRLTDSRAAAALEDELSTREPSASDLFTQDDEGRLVSVKFGGAEFPVVLDANRPYGSFSLRASRPLGDITPGGPLDPGMSTTVAEIARALRDFDRAVPQTRHAEVTTLPKRIGDLVGEVRLLRREAEDRTRSLANALKFSPEDLRALFRSGDDGFRWRSLTSAVVQLVEDERETRRLLDAVPEVAHLREDSVRYTVARVLERLVVLEAQVAEQAGVAPPVPDFDVTEIGYALKLDDVIDAGALTHRAVLERIADWSADVEVMRVLRDGTPEILMGAVSADPELLARWIVAAAQAVAREKGAPNPTFWIATAKKLADMTAVAVRSGVTDDTSSDPVPVFDGTAERASEGSVEERRVALRERYGVVLSLVGENREVFPVGSSLPDSVFAVRSLDDLDREGDRPLDVLYVRGEGGGWVSRGRNGSGALRTPEQLATVPLVDCSAEVRYSLEEFGDAYRVMDRGTGKPVRGLVLYTKQGYQSGRSRVADMNAPARPAFLDCAHGTSDAGGACAACGMPSGEGGR